MVEKSGARGGVHVGVVDDCLQVAAYDADGCFDFVVDVVGHLSREVDFFFDGVVGHLAFAFDFVDVAVALVVEFEDFAGDVAEFVGWEDVVVAYHLARCYVVGKFAEYDDVAREGAGDEEDYEEGYGQGEGYRCPYDVDELSGVGRVGAKGGFSFILIKDEQPEDETQDGRDRDEELPLVANPFL